MKMYKDMTDIEKFDLAGGDDTVKVARMLVWEEDGKGDNKTSIPHYSEHTDELWDIFYDNWQDEENKNRDYNANEYLYSFANMKEIENPDTINLYGKDGTIKIANQMYKLGKENIIGFNMCPLPIFQTEINVDLFENNVLSNMLKSLIGHKEDMIYTFYITYIRPKDKDYLLLSIGALEADDMGASSFGLAVMKILYNKYCNKYGVLPMTINEDCEIFGFNSKILYDLGEYLAYMWSGIQYRIANPTEFIRIKHKKSSKEYKNSITKHNNKTKIIKVQKIVNIYLDENDSAEVNIIKGGHIVYHASVWDVKGHWRNYKSGKRSWVNAYQKGKDRNKGITVEGKIYKIIDEET